MDLHNNATAQKLLKSFILFEKAEWHQRSVVGYKPSEIKVLFCIKRGGQSATPEMKVSEISKLLHVTPPSVTQLLKGLEGNGLIERNIDPIDRRAVGIKLTEKGEMVTQKAAEAFSISLKGLIEYMGEDQSDQLAELLAKVFTYFNEKETILNRCQCRGDEKI